MQRRQLLKLAPLAALAALPITVGGAEAKRYELRKDKKYLFVFEGQVTQGFAADFKEAMTDRGVDCVVLGGCPDVKAYELEAK